MRVLLLTVSTPAEVQDLSSTLLLCDKSIIITFFSQKSSRRNNAFKYTKSYLICCLAAKEIMEICETGQILL